VGESTDEADEDASITTITKPSTKHKSKLSTIAKLNQPDEEAMTTQPKTRARSNTPTATGLTS
jgi:hypothetical protein